MCDAYTLNWEIKPVIFNARSPGRPKVDDDDDDDDGVKKKGHLNGPPRTTLNGLVITGNCLRSASSSHDY